MKTRRMVPALLVLVVMVLGLTWSLALAETLYVQRTKVEIKQGQGAFYPTIYTAKRGEALEVLSQQNGWYQVKTPKGLGWVFSEALSAKQDSGFMTGLLGTADTSELDKTAGFKGFDAPTEKAYVSQNNLASQMRMVDNLEKQPFTIADLKKFMQQGQLGSTGGGQ